MLHAPHCCNSRNRARDHTKVGRRVQAEWLHTLHCWKCMGAQGGGCVNELAANGERVAFAEQENHAAWPSARQQRLREVVNARRQKHAAFMRLSAACVGCKSSRELGECTRLLRWAATWQQQSSRLRGCTQSRPTQAACTSLQQMRCNQRQEGAGCMGWKQWQARAGCAAHRHSDSTCKHKPGCVYHVAAVSELQRAAASRLHCGKQSQQHSMQGRAPGCGHQMRQASCTDHPPPLLLPLIHPPPLFASAPGPLRCRPCIRQSRGGVE